MFVDFNKVFNDKSQAQLAIPQPLIDYMNKSLPKGVKYCVDQNGNCVVSSETGLLLIGGFVFNPTKEQLKILGNNYTQQDVLCYFYNSQRPIPLTLQKEGYICLNGQEFPIEKMSFNPLVSIKHTESMFWMYPHQFPDPFPVRIGNSKYEREILISRVPNESVHIMSFESNAGEPLKIQYFINDNEPHISMNLSLNLLDADKILDLVQATSIYNAFIDGKATFMGWPFGSGLNDNEAKRFDDDSIVFWERVLEIEKILEVHFCPPKDDVKIEDIYLVEQLYQSLVNRVPTRDNEVINSLSGNWKTESLGFDIDDMIGKPMFFRFECTSQIDLFGVKKELPVLVGVVNAILSAHKSNGKKQEVMFSDESEDKRRFNSIMFFESENALLKFISGDYQVIIDLFENAKRPSEFL